MNSSYRINSGMARGLRTIQPPAEAEGRGDGFVQSKSVQQQFTILTNDRDKFRKEKELAEKELEQVQAGYQEIKGEQEDLAIKNFHAKAELGHFSKKLHLLQEEEKRTARYLSNDTRAVEDCTKRLKVLDSEKETMANKFVTEMNTSTVEVAIFLQQRLEKKIERNISIQSVSTVLLPFLETKKNEGYPELQNGLFGLNESIDKLKKATASLDQAATHLYSILTSFQEMGVDLDTLMEAAEHSDEKPMESRTKESSASDNMELFYGEQQDDHDGLQETESEDYGNLF